jgi:hypothetical protein
MKKLVEIIEQEGEGLMSLMGEQVVLFCSNYFYAGKLIGVNDDFVLLEDGGIVYETGDFSEKHWKDFQRVSEKLYVRTSFIESFCRGK